MRKIDWDHGRRLFLQGKSLGQIAKTIKCDKSSVSKRSKREGWKTAEEVLSTVDGGLTVAKQSGEIARTDGEKSAEDIRERLKVDVVRVLDALDAVLPSDLSLGQLVMRERVAGDVLKRAESVFQMVEKEKPVVNIALLSQMPDNLSSVR